MKRCTIRRFAAGVLAALCFATVTGCGAQTADNPTSTETTEADAATETTVQTTETTAPTAVIPEEDVLCRTPYITLTVPEYWDNRITVSSFDGVGKYELHFKMTLNEKEATLFSFFFGERSSGYRLGSLQADGQEVAVFCEIGVFEVGDTWNESEVQTLTAFQECVNELLAQIQQAANFSATQ